MGRVYRAVQVGLNRAVALKILDSNYGAGRDESFRQRFLVEGALTAKLSHPNTVRVFDYGCTADGIFYLAMEFLDGETLDNVLALGPLAWRRVLSIGQQIARALREAHELGVVHRDLKPGNVMLLAADDDTDHIKVLDFGLVKSFVEGHELEGRAITQQGMLMGSPPYMAPEQGDKNRADPRSDIYSLGCILFEALTGRPPYDGGGPLEIILKHVNQPIPELRTPSNFEPIPALMAEAVRRCLQKLPMDRFQSMDELLQALSELASPIQTPTLENQAPAPASPSLVRPSRRPNTPLLLVGFLAALVAGVAGTALVLRRGKPGPEPQPRVIFHIETNPSGAQVVIGKVIKGVTPLDVELSPASDGRAQADVTLQKEGFLPLTVTAAGSGPRIELMQKLAPAIPSATPSNTLSPKSALPPAIVAPATRELQEVKKAQSAAPVVVPVTPPAPPPRVYRPAKRPPAASAKPAARLDEKEDAPMAPPLPPNDLKRPQ
jgi:serine/threonine-protein kinase